MTPTQRWALAATTVLIYLIAGAVRARASECTEIAPSTPEWALSRAQASPKDDGWPKVAEMWSGVDDFAMDADGGDFHIIADAQ